jgi:hypothetical protein
MPHLPPAHHETSKHDSPNKTKIKERQNETVPDSNSKLAKSMTHYNQTNELTTWFLNMSAKPCDNYKMIMVKYVDLWLLHSQVASLLDSARLELRELKTCSILLGACTSCPVLRSDLEASIIEIKDLKHKLDHSSCYTVLSPPCVVCGSLNDKLFHATKENTKLK